MMLVTGSSVLLTWSGMKLLSYRRVLTCERSEALRSTTWYNITSPVSARVRVGRPWLQIPVVGARKRPD